jgi:hypothetical protein
LRVDLVHSGGYDGVIVTSDRDAFELWHYGTWRCLMTPREGTPPFRVTIYENHTVLSKSVFDDHEKAVAFAVKALRAATRDHP